MDLPHHSVSQHDFKMLDSLLHCSICYEYLHTAMMIDQCSHNSCSWCIRRYFSYKLRPTCFADCSLCIRRYFTYKRECPTCFLTASDTDLVKNRQLDNIVEQYKIIRHKLFGEPADNEPSTLGVSETLESRYEHPPVEVTASTSGATKVTPSTSQSEQKACTSQSSVSPVMKTEDTTILASSTSILNYEQESIHNDPSPTRADSAPSVDKVLCPVCSVAIRERYMNQHLDRCLQREEKKESLRSFSPKRKPLPKLVYTLMTDKELKRRLQELKLSTLGDRQVLIKRHQEYTLLYNAECDAAQPRSIPDILKELEKNEANLTKLAKASKQTTLNFAKASSAEEVEKVENDYLQENKSRFEQLVAEAGKNMKRKRKKPQVIDITGKHETCGSQTLFDRQTTSLEQTTLSEQTSFQDVETADREKLYKRTTLAGETVRKGGKEIVILDGERHQTILSFVKNKVSNTNTIQKSREGFSELPALSVAELEDGEVQYVEVDNSGSDAAVHVNENVVQTGSGDVETSGNSNSNCDLRDVRGNVEFSQTSDSLLPCSQSCRMRSPEKDLTAESDVDSDMKSEASESLLQSNPVLMQTPTTSSNDQCQLVKNNSSDVETSPVFHETGRSRKMSTESEVDIFGSSPVAALSDDVIKSCGDVTRSCGGVTSPCKDVITPCDNDAKIHRAQGQVLPVSVEEPSAMNSTDVSSPDDFTCAWDFDLQPVVTRRSLRKRKVTVSPSGGPARKRINKKGMDSYP